MTLPPDDLALRLTGAAPRPAPRAESDLQRALDLAAVGVVETDATGRFIYANAAALQILRLSADAITARTFNAPAWRLTTVGGDPIPDHELPGARALRGETVRGFLHALESNVPGERRVLLANAAPVLDAAGTVTGVIGSFTDVTGEVAADLERARLSRELAAHRALVDGVVAQMPAGVIIAEAPSGAIRYHNAEAERLLGHPVHPAADVAGYARYGGLHADGREFAAHEYTTARALAGETVLQEEMRYRRGDGRIVYLSVSAAPVLDEHGAPTSVVCTFVDVTERHRAEERTAALQRVTAALSRAASAADVVRSVVVEALPAVGAYAADLTTPGARTCTASRWQGGVGGGDGDGPLIAAAEHVCELAGEDALALHSPAEIGARTGSVAHALAAAGTRALIALPLRPPSGDALGCLILRFVEACDFAHDEVAFATVVAEQAAQALYRLRLFAAEAAAREAAERAAAHLSRMQTLAASLSALLTEAEIGRVVLDAAMALFGARSGSVLLVDGDSLRNVSWVGYEDVSMAEWKRYPLDLGTPGGRAAVSGEPIFIDDDAAWVAAFPQWRGWIRQHALEGYAALPLRAEGRAIGVVTLNFSGPMPFAAHDRDTLLGFANQTAQALERARLFRDAERARAEAETANRTKSEFLARMSHELRTPLNAIGGYTQLLELGIRGPVTTAQLEDLARIGRAQQHLLGLINTVLEFAKLEAGQVHYEIADVPLVDAVRAVEGMVAPMLRAKAIALSAAAHEGAPAVARADADKLRQIVLNLLTNAAKFTAPGGRVDVRWGADGDAVALTVADSGVGIPADQLDAVFGAFVQLHDARAGRAEGTGLGLAISRDFARAMGGDLTAASEPGAGSTFTLTLPRAGAR